MDRSGALTPTTTASSRLGPRDPEFCTATRSKGRGSPWAKDCAASDDRERSGWGDEATVSAYVSNLGPVSDEIAQVLAARAARSELTVLDLCCGHGALTAMLCQAGANVFGIDLSDKMLERARRAAPRATFIKCDAAQLPFREEAFDAVVCNFGMLHLSHRARSLAEVRRVLRPGGDFLTATWAIPRASNAFGIMLDAIRAHADLACAPQQPDFFALARASTAQKMMAGAGLRLTAHDEMTPLLRLQHPDELFTIFLTATVTVSMLIRSQSDDIVARIRRDVAAAVAANCTAGGGYLVPLPVVIMNASRT